MNESTRKRLGVLLIFFSVGVAGAVTYAVTNESQPAKPAANGQQTGTGTVVGGPSAQPTPSPDKGDNGSSNNGGGPKGEFYISGSVTGLTPGNATVLPLTITNPNPWPIQVLTIDTGVGTPTGSPCPGSSLAVGQYTFTNGTKITAAAKSTVQMTVPVTLTDSPTENQTGCLGATFPLTFTGTAEKADKK
jgi:hypothetical protein